MRGALLAVVEREFKRFLRQKGRLVSTFARPLLWLVVIGSGFAAVMPTAVGVTYHQYMLPGIFGMVLLFSSMLSALSTVHDREFGPIRMLLIAPLPQSGVVAAKTVSSMLLGVAQVLLLFPLIPLVGLRPGAAELTSLIGAVFVTSLALSSLGMLIASRARSIENFAVVMNFVLFPMFFLSGALYPTASLSGFLQPFVRANPLTYGIDLMRPPLLASAGGGISPAEFAPIFSLAVLLVFSAVGLGLSAFLFRREEHLSRILMIGRPRGGDAQGSGQPSSRKAR